MSHVTQVPLRPVGRGTVRSLWLGLAAAVGLAGVAAYAGTAPVRGTGCSAKDLGSRAGVVTLPGGTLFQTRKAGSGKMPTDTDVALVKYKGWLRNGTVFDQSERAPLPVAGLVPGFTAALKAMQVGGDYRICIPSSQGYGARAAGPIPANSVLIFDVSLLDFRSEAEIRAMQQQMQMMQQQQGAPSPQ